VSALVVVIDSCTWIDAALYGGIEETAIVKAFDSAFIAGCDRLWEEIDWALTRKFHLPVDVVAETLGFYRMHTLNITTTGEIKGSIDPNDDFLLECAVKAKAKLIISGDLKHLVRMKSFEGIRIVTPNDYVHGIALEATQ
jgi:predicted nucleic acid-binding protein